jgi:hypothetical protein
MTAAKYVDGSGRDVMLGLALGYTVQSRLVDHGIFMTFGFEHTAQFAVQCRCRPSAWFERIADRQRPCNGCKR